MTDIGNAYLNAQTKEKYYITLGQEFGDDKGILALIVRALYGLKGSGVAWHDHFAKSLTNIGFRPSQADYDVWLRLSTKDSGEKYYKYVMVYVDDIIHISEHPMKLMLQFQDVFNYKLCEVTKLKHFFGAKIGKYTMDSGESTWYLSTQQYLKKVFLVIKAHFAIKLETMCSKSKQDLLASTKYHAELDDTDYLNIDDTNLYQS